jgi:predicted metal-dependent hydrolase
MAHAQHDDKQFRRGIEQFNSRQFFEAHETWEEIWLHAAEPEKTFLQGIIQVAAAFHHYRRGNRAGTQSLLKAGLRKLDHFPGDHHGLKLEALRAAANRWAAALATGEDPGEAELPQIERPCSNERDR